MPTGSVIEVYWDDVTLSWNGVKEKMNITAAEAANAARDAANGLTTLVYGAIGAALVAALLAIFSLMQISRRIAG